MKDKKVIKVGLAGNPNCGKSTIFNQLTGSRQHVGNYPGVTVEKKEGKASWNGYGIEVTDLPGTYSLSAYSEDELVARNFVIKEKPDVIVHVVDASNLERNLYLFTQLAELDTTVVLAMNMSDIVEKKGRSIDYGELSVLLGSPIVPTVGNKNKGMDDLLDMIVKVYEGEVPVSKVRIDYGEEINALLEELKEVMAKDAPLAGRYPLQWLAVKLFENDAFVTEMIGRSAFGQDLLARVKKGQDHLRRHFSEEPEVLIADRRYGFISGACMTTTRQSVEERHDLSDRIDKIILNRFLGLPIFALVMFGIFKFTFTFSEPVVAWFESVFVRLGEAAASVIPGGILQSFVVDGIIGGVGGVLGYFPLVLFMFFAIAFFEDSGYMARAAFVMDKIMSKFGLHRKSFLPKIGRAHV
jgi:ferrous iron transport protein B